MGSILKQLLGSIIDSADHDILDELLMKSTQWDPLLLASALSLYLPTSKPIKIMLDGIDELQTSELQSLLDAPNSLARSFESRTAVHFFITCRLDIVKSITFADERRHVAANDVDLGEDMARVDAIIQMKMDNGLLPVGQAEDVGFLIQYAVEKDAEGMLVPLHRRTLAIVLVASVAMIHGHFRE